MKLNSLVSLKQNVFGISLQHEKREIKQHCFRLIWNDFPPPCFWLGDQNPVLQIVITNREK